MTSIEDYAFACCESLTSVTIPDGVTSIEDYAFAWCESLTSVTIPDSVTNIGDFAFDDTPWLETLAGENPFVIMNGILLSAGTVREGDILIPDGVTRISQSAYLDCDGLTSVTIPESVTAIGEYAFAGCNGLTSVTIPESVTSIGESAFESCENLNSVIILNPKCRIDEYVYGNGLTFCNSSDWDGLSIIGYYSGTIFGYENSTAQAYAEKYGYTFESLGAAPAQETTAPQGTALPLGDLDNSGTIDIMDVIKINKFLLGSATLTPDEKTAADVNGNGDVDSTDSLNILKYVVELITDFSAI